MSKHIHIHVTKDANGWSEEGSASGFRVGDRVKVKTDTGLSNERGGTVKMVNPSAGLVMLSDRRVFDVHHLTKGAKAKDESRSDLIDRLEAKAKRLLAASKLASGSEKAALKQQYEAVMKDLDRAYGLR